MSASAFSVFTTPAGITVAVRSSDVVKIEAMTKTCQLYLRRDPKGCIVVMGSLSKVLRDLETSEP